MFPNSNLARLSQRGTTYRNALTTFPSDSFLGMPVLATDGTPQQTGVDYDISYNRATWNPVTNCTGAPRQATPYDESIDQSTANLSGTSNTGLSGAGFSASAMNPANLPEAMVNGACTPIAPRNCVEANTLFEVADNAELLTAWSDRRPTYDILNGNDKYKTAPADSITDLTTPEINSTIHPGRLTVPFGPDKGSPVTRTGDYTSSIDAVMAYDNLKVQAVLNQIDGKTSQRGSVGGPQTVRSIFGMNFHSMAIGQMLPVGGNYNDGGAFSPGLLTALEFVDSSVGRFTADRRPRVCRTAPRSSSPPSTASRPRTAACCTGSPRATEPPAASSPSSTTRPARTRSAATRATTWAYSGGTTRARPPERWPLRSTPIRRAPT